MSRDLDPALEDAIAEPVVRPFLAAHIDLPDPVYAWTGIGTVNFGGAEWTGAGKLGAIGSIGEESDNRAVGVTATLFNAPAEFRDDIAEQAVPGDLFEIHFGALNETFQQVEATKLLWRGRVGKYEITDAGDSLSVVVGGESRAIDQRRPAIKRFTDEYQQRQYPGDRFFEYVPQMTEIPILWARQEQNNTGGGGGGGAGRTGHAFGNIHSR